MISINYNPIKDLKNWLRIKTKYPDNFCFTKYYPFNEKIELNKNNFNLILKTINIKQIKKFNQQAGFIRKEWQKNEKEIIKKITSYLKMPNKKFNFKVNLTTAYLMPYSFKDRWFMVPTHKKIQGQIECMVHELFHLYHLKKDPRAKYEELERKVQDFLRKLG